MTITVEALCWMEKVFEYSFAATQLQKVLSRCGKENVGQEYFTWSVILVTGQKRGQVEEAECTHAILHRRHDDVSNRRESFRVVDVES
jgi:hypothetical protein